MYAGCVRCGSLATEGSLRHPYCKECFRIVWGGDNVAYFEWLEMGHDEGVSPQQFMEQYRQRVKKNG